MPRRKPNLRPFPGAFVGFAFQAQNQFGHGFVFQIREATAQGRIHPDESALSEIGETILSLSAKLDCLWEALVSADQALGPLGQLLRDHPSHDIKYAFPADQRLLRQAVLAVESVAYQTYSCLDLRFLDRRILHIPERNFDELLSRAGFDESILGKLRQWRHIFTHETGPWPAADLSNRAHPKLIMVQRGGPPQGEWFYVEELAEVVRRFYACVLPLQTALLQPLTDTE